MIVSLNETHFLDIILLSNNAFGKGFFSKEDLNQYKDSSHKLAFVYIEKNIVVGYILICTLTYPQFMSTVFVKKKWFANNFKTSKSIHLIKQIVVKEEYQNKGIASLLIKESLIHTSNESSETCCLAWKKGNNTGLKSSLLKNGFTYKVSIDRYWNKDSIIKNYNCTFCGNPPCNCSAEVYIKSGYLK